MDRQKEFKTSDGNKLDTDWQANVKIGIQYDEISQKILDTFAEFSEIWGGCLGHINVAEHRIDSLHRINVLST